MIIQKNILWVDCCAAVSAGLIVLLAAQWLSQIYHLPKTSSFSLVVLIYCMHVIHLY